MPHRALSSFKIAATLLFFAGIIGPGVVRALPLQCTVNPSVTPVLRADGEAELIENVVLNCTGGTPTAAGLPVPAMSLQIVLNVSVTSRILATGWSEALMSLDDPSQPIQRVCGTAGDVQPVTGVCTINGTGNGIGVYDGSAGRPNIFQGRQATTNSIVWVGAPFDPPGNGQRIIRLTNIRANVSALPIVVPPPAVIATVGSGGPGAVPINNPQQTVGFANPDLSFSAVTPLACLGKVGGKPAAATSIQISEGFATAWKTRTEAAFIDNNTSPPPADQAMIGAIFNTETGFFNSAFPTLPPRGNLARAGLADQGTRLFVRFTNVPAGIDLLSPAVLTIASLTVARRVSTGVNGGGAFAAAPVGPSGYTLLSNFSGTAEAVYEILETGPFNIETLKFPVIVLDAGGVGLSALSNSTMIAGFAPLSQVTSASAAAPVPRFAEPKSSPLVLPPPNCP